MNTDRPSSSLSPTSATSPRLAAGPHRRSSKACETCRVRRVKCTGSPPCEACRAAGIASSCTVRLKARPKRAPSAKLNGRQHESELSFEKNDGGDLQQLPPAVVVEKRNPLDQVKTALSVWCSDRGILFSQLTFNTEDTRLASMPITPLASAPKIHEIEDQLMDEFLTTSTLSEDNMAPDNDSLLQDMYRRYRTVPASLTDDQRALVYATLCIARFNQLRRRLDSSSPREDVTYFRLACDALVRWRRPSLIAIWSLFYLIPYSLGLGGPTETKDLLEQWAWQVRELGLHTRAMADMYHPYDQVGKLFSAIFYSDILCACLTDLQPSLPLEEIEIDPRPPADMFPDSLRHCSYFTAKFLADYSDPHVDTASAEYIGSAEAAWMPHLRELRHSSSAEPPVKRAWAEFRYNWLRLLHYTPHLSHPNLAPQAYAAVARAVSQVLHTYESLVKINQLHPAWPHVQRLVVCGHFLILCFEYGEVQHREGELLFRMLVDLLGKHQHAWPSCAELASGFAAAAHTFNMRVSPTPKVVEDDRASPPPTFAHFAYELSLDFDLSTFAVPI